MNPDLDLFVLHVKEVVLFNDSDHSSKSDVYLKINVGGESINSRVIFNDNTPTFDCKFAFLVTPETSPDCTGEVYDKDIVDNDGEFEQGVSEGSGLICYVAIVTPVLVLSHLR